MQARPRVLVADDEAPILAATCDLLEELGFEADVVCEAAQVLPRALAFRPRAILQDVRMPGLDLRALVGAIRKEPSLAGARVVLFSAGMEVEDVARDLGVAWIEKPFKPATLLAALGVAAAP